ncbi:MAG: ribonuclease D, partial [Steroidobacteraceae bacterium]|nr:ribonuclease D [Steroidobacteraceae bacterium]MDW8260371.1 ribonuclease D [Gammaproteobacteria bacterium]
MSHLPLLLDDPRYLPPLRERLAAASTIGVDTEFMRERTYRAQLCLLQLGGSDWATCLDTLTLSGTDLAGIADLLAAFPGETIMHAARQDLEALQPLFAPPRRIFDTQIAAALCGMPTQIGYADLVQRVLGRELDKAQTRTDWSKRPLTAAQLRYAIEDVQYLPPLRAALLDRLDPLGRVPW